MAEDLRSPGRRFGITRRGLLMGNLAGIFAAAWGVLPAGPGGARRALAQASAFAPSLWFQIAPDGTVTVNVAKAEMGQHIGTALAQALAEELEADWSSVRIVHVDSDPRWGLMITGGSTSVNLGFETMARAGAAGRLALVEAGARRLGIAVADCRAEAGAVVAGNGRRVRYAELVAAGAVEPRAMSQDALKALPLKHPSEYRLLGRSVPALDIPAKTNGTARYGIDAARESMAYGRPVTPPTRHGASVRSIDESAAREVPGYLRAVRIEDPSGTFQGWVVALAETYPAAIAAADALKVDWDPGANAGVDDAALASAQRALQQDPTAARLFVDVGDAPGALAGAAGRRVEATYTTDLTLHAPMEPVNALAWEEGGMWHLVAGNQFQSAAVPLVARAIGVEPQRVVLHQRYLGGGFGRRLYGDYLIPAALAAKAAGRPVKLIYSRTDDLRFDCARTPTYQVVSGSLGPGGTIAAVSHDVVAGWPAFMIAPQFMMDAADKKGKVDASAVSGADFWYTVPNHRVRAIRDELAHRVLSPGWLRSVGPGFTVFAVESFMDEMALAVGVDPAEFRLRHLDGAGDNAGRGPSEGGALRLAAVLREALRRSGYGQKAKLPGSAFGIAASPGQERDMPTFTACVAEVAVATESGEVRVEKLTVVTDVGTPLNPDGVMAQLESATLWGVSLALYDRASLSEGGIEATNFDGFTPLRMSQVPTLDLAVMPSTAFPVGTGEPPTTAVCPAIANAVAAATGKRVRALPITPERVKAARAT